ncbi:helix-hairpin-helix domain-containing protein [Croceitalea sp. MTPC9]|uniref:ComEA family DNA-binding protein n=1 Tax=unclassified Croceitalea TaxID=2632280 RepID=UPI002B396C18|nr:helix-hairpin-helix domain-containing protein [Croceitalea sp. MTPC6]GMN18316.1 helix-hairpin-helix domain-containing protein [Croceitalea sp. MTPC9]
MKNFKSHFKFNKQERSGIFFLLLIIIILQGVYFYIKSQPINGSESKITVDEIEQAKIDSLKKIAQTKDSVTIFPFNPNFISDYKGYTLGMSVEEIDRLHAFRAQNNYLNSKEDFQKVTKINDSLLRVISPYFKFPDWTQSNKNQYSKKSFYKSSETNTINIQDINSVTAKDLKRINGIGNKLSARIIKFRDKLGGFLVNEQLFDVYGLDTEVATRALKEFQVVNTPSVEKININSATAGEIAALVYISYPVANEIVRLRELNGGINSFDELTNLDGFPSEKLDRIALYLSL